MKLSECYFTNGNKISFFINGGNFLAGWVNITGKKKSSLSETSLYDVDTQK
jgi:hypothetical protein